MTTTIHKFTLRPRPSFGAQAIDLPVDAQILDCQMQGGRLALWALLDPSATSLLRAFRVYATGTGLPTAPGRYIATVQDGPYVWHVFEVPSREAA